jgi:steroid delta-isomerase-like uncharacterized protein
MSQDAAQLARRWFEEVWNQQRDETIRELMDPKVHGVLEGGLEVHSTDEFMKARAQLLDAFPDMRVAVEDVIAQGENVVVRWRASATHTGAAMDLKPSQRAVSFRGMTWMVFRDGRMIEGWDAWNQGALLQSLQS